MTNNDIYERIITGDENPISLRFDYRAEAFEFQRKFYTNLEPHNEYINSEIRYNPAAREHYDYELIFWL